MDALEGDEELARIVAFAAKLCNAPIALVSIVEEHRQRFLVQTGLDEQETPREWSFCAHAMIGGNTTIIRDAREHPTFKDNPLVTGPPHIRFYAGIPLISNEGAPLGTLCVIDAKPRAEGLNEFQGEGLEVLALAVRRRLDAHREFSRASDEIEESADRVRFVLDSMPDIAWSSAAGGVFDYFNARWEEITGLTPPQSVEDWRAAIHPDDYDRTLKKFSDAVLGAEMFEDEWRMIQADGSYRWVLSRAIPSTDDPETARWFGTLTDIDDAYRMSQERELLAGELAHRIKNIFSVVIGLITLHSRGDEVLKVFGDMLSDNIRALSRAQEYALQVESPADSDLHGLLAVLMAPYGANDGDTVVITGDQAMVGARAATPLALVFHELATNSAKYGALSVMGGKLSLSIKRSDDDVVIGWIESGGPTAVAPEKTGFGSRLLMATINNQLGGSIEHDWREEGLSMVITLPTARLAE
ncbi:PAS domain-containing protein [Erythrobacter rubeus]|uniref:histidine kinase n=1 Tax=Erythrobacter rubeus TaxID=2760803 RepID=A0ABR8KQD3_9SPHN|nr:PAS domain-containing protein [Erythrobacter rubeus]MBD2842978.1 PAS domain-containing protein [Erythrobacter rubeus]